MNLTGTSSETARQLSARLTDMTMPRLLRERVAAVPDQVAIRYKRFGIFQQFTWRQFFEQIRAAAAGLIGLGLDRGERIAIMGDTCVEYVLVDHAATYIGAVPCGVYMTSSPDEVAYVVQLAGARHFLAEDQEHLDRLLEAERIAGRQLVEHILLADDRTLFLYPDKRIIRFQTFLDRAQDDLAGHAEAERRADAVQPDSIGEIIFTSGTTGQPKAAAHTHAGMLMGFGFYFLDALPELRARPHRVVSHLPLAHGMERGMTLKVPMMADVVPHIGEPNQDLLSIMSEVRPSFVLGVPRIWEKLVAHVHVGIENSTLPARAAFGLATWIGRRRTRQVWRSGRRRALPLTELAYRFARFAIFWPALHKIGLTYCVGGVSGGAPTPPAVMETVEMWGIPLRDFYGTTEVAVVGTPRAPWPAAGAPIEPCHRREIRIAGDGELFVRGPGLIAGYFGDHAATEAVFDGDGFLGTGDFVRADEGGGFIIVDRKKDIIITSGGKNIAPAAIENALKASPYISEVIIFGDSRQYVTALIEIDFDNVSHWARQNHIPYTGFVSLVQNPKTVQLIAAEVDRQNRRLSRVEQVKKFRIIGKELEPEDGDTTPTRKVKRAHAYRLFGHLVEEMYAEGGHERAVQWN